MEISQYVENYQPILYKTFSNALKTKKIPHAFLLAGSPGIPLKKIGIYMAQSFLCDNPNPLADLTCNTCLRISKGEYPDVALFDGSEETIKKEKVEDIINCFSKTSLEKKGIMVYIVHLVERMTDDAINSLLKFLEEPSEGTYAILTTENDTKVLPTIVSRCETIRLTPRPQQDVLKEALALNIRQSDSEILSNLLNDADLIKEVSQDEDYMNAKTVFDTLVDALPDYKRVRYIIEKDGISLVKGKVSLRYFFDMLTLFYQDISNKKMGNHIKLQFYDNIIAGLVNLPNVDESLKDIMILRRKIETNIHGGLLLVHLSNIIAKD